MGSMIGRIDCKWWGLWEASGTYPSKINPRTPHPHRGSLSHPAFELSTSQAQFPHKDKSSVSKSPSQQKLPVEQIFWGTDPLGASVGCSISFKLGLPRTQLPPNPPREGKPFFFFGGRVLFIGCTSGTWRNRNANPASARWSMSFLAL